MALLIDRVFKKIGLNGRAVIPMILGFGCSTMATIVTRTLETRRERIIATFLLALAVPCSAQLGVLLSILSGNPLAIVIWAMSRSPMALVASLRETSVIFGALIGAVLLGEPFGHRRVLAAAVVAAGVVLLSLSA